MRFINPNQIYDSANNSVVDYIKQAYLSPYFYLSPEERAISE